MRLSSLCVSIWAIPTASRETRREVFYTLDLCLVVSISPERSESAKQMPYQGATRNEDKPGSREVKRNKGKQDVSNAGKQKAYEISMRTM